MLQMAYMGLPGIGGNPMLPGSRDLESALMVSGMGGLAPAGLGMGKLVNTLMGQRGSVGIKRTPQALDKLMAKMYKEWQAHWANYTPKDPYLHPRFLRRMEGLPRDRFVEDILLAVNDAAQYAGQPRRVIPYLRGILTPTRQATSPEVAAAIQLARRAGIQNLSELTSGAAAGVDAPIEARLLGFLEKILKEK